jgi:hypothetical protein
MYAPIQLRERDLLVLRNDCGLVRLPARHIFQGDRRKKT